ncbi:MAG: hypothetical protein ACFE9T_04745 [Promethearchaeota archaeon]
MNFFFRSKVSQDFDKYANYLGFALDEKEGGYYNRSNYFIKRIGELWKGTTISGGKVYRRLPEIKEVKIIDEYLKTLK